MCECVVLICFAFQSGDENNDDSCSVDGESVCDCDHRVKYMRECTCDDIDGT